MKSLLGDSAHAPRVPDSSGAFTGSSRRRSHVAGNTTTRDTFPPHEVQGAAMHRTAAAASKSLPVDTKDLKPCASDPRASQFSLQQQTAPQSASIHAAQQSVSDLEPPTSSVAQCSDTSVKGDASHRVLVAAEKGSYRLSQQHHLAPSGSTGAHTTALGESHPVELRDQPVATCRDLETNNESCRASLNSTNATGCCLITTSSTWSTNTTEIDAAAPLTLHNHNGQGEVLNVSNQRIFFSESSALHESLSTVSVSTKKRPQTQPLHQQSQLYSQQHHRLSLQPQQLNRLHNTDECLVLEIPLQHDQLSITRQPQPSTSYQGTRSPPPDTSGHSDGLQQRRQLLERTESTPQTLPLPVLVANVGAGNVSNSELLETTRDRVTQQLPCAFPLTCASYDSGLTCTSATTEGQRSPRDQQQRIPVHAENPTNLQARENEDPDVSSRILLTDISVAHPRDKTSPLLDLPFYSKRPKTADVGDTDFAGVANGVSAFKPPLTLQTADSGVRLISSMDPVDADPLKQARETRHCSVGAFSSRLDKASTGTRFLDTVQTATKGTGTAKGNTGGQQNSVNNLYAPPISNNTTLGGLYVPFVPVQCVEKPSSCVCPQAPRSQTDTDNYIESAFPSSKAGDTTTSTHCSRDADAAVHEIQKGDRVHDTQCRGKEAPATYTLQPLDAPHVMNSSRVCESMPLSQAGTIGRGCAASCSKEVERVATHVTEKNTESECTINGSAPLDNSCATGSRRSLPLAAAANGEASLLMEQDWSSTGTSTNCTLATVKDQQEPDSAQPGTDGGPVLEAKIDWGRKRGPYDRPVRFPLSDNTKSCTLTKKKQEAIQCQTSTTEEGGEQMFVVAAKNIMQMATEPKSSSSMASTRATTPTTRPSSGSSSSTPSAAENPCTLDRVATLHSLAATAPSKAEDNHFSSRNPQARAATEGQLVLQAPRRRLVRLCDSDEEIWNEWEGQSMLGEGVYGRVYLVRSRKTGEERAFKRMYLQVSRLASSRSSKAVDPGDQEGGDSGSGMPVVANGGLPAVVQREIASLKALQGVRNVITLEEVFIGSRRVYLSFPVIRGGSLSELLRRYAIWQEHLLSVHQTASSACTVASPEEHSLPSGTTVRPSEVHISHTQSAKKSCYCCNDSASECCELGRGDCRALSTQDCCHTTRWDCRCSNGKSECTNSSIDNHTACCPNPLTISDSCCKYCANNAADNTAQPRHCVSVSLLEGNGVGSRCERAGQDADCMQGRAIDGTEEAHTIGAGVLKQNISTACHSSAPKSSPCLSSIPLNMICRRSSTCSGKKEDENPAYCRSHACGEVASCSVPVSSRGSECDTSSLTQCSSAAAVVACCCSCCTMHLKMEKEEASNEPLNDPYQAPGSTCGATSSSSRPSSLANVFRLASESSRPAASLRSLFSPPFSYPDMPPCGLPLPLAKSIVQAILRGVTACHERRIAHRDMKPDNILLDWVPQPPPSPPPPPPSPTSDRSPSPGLSSQMRSCHVQSGWGLTQQHICCTERTGSCVKSYCCCSKEAGHSDKANYRSLSDEKTVCESNTVARHCGKQIYFSNETQNDVGYTCHLAGCTVDAHDGRRPGRPAAAAGRGAPTGAVLDACKAVRALLLREKDGAAEGVSRERTEEAGGHRDVYWGGGASEDATAAAGGQTNEEGADAEATEEVEEPNQNVTDGTASTKVQPKDAESSGRKRERPAVDGKMREPTIWATSGMNDQSAGTRRRICTTDIAVGGNCTGETIGAESVGASDAVSAKALGSAAPGAAEPGAAAHEATLSLTYEAAGVVFDGSNAQELGIPAASVKDRNSKCAAAALSSNAGDCVPHSGCKAVTTSALGTGAAAVTAGVLAAAKMKKTAKGQNEAQEFAEAASALADKSEITCVAGGAEEEYCDGSNGSTGDGIAVVDEQKDASTPETQRSEDSLGTPEYPPRPTRLVIADFGLARTLPFCIPFSPRAPLRSSSCRARHKQRQRCPHDRQQAQFVLPATAAVPSTRCTSSCTNSCWVRHNSGCCLPCSNETDDMKKTGLEGLLARSQAPCVHKCGQAAAQVASTHEGGAEEVAPSSTEGCCEGPCQQGRSKRHEKWHNENAAPDAVDIPCNGSSCGKAPAETARFSWWMQCTSASDPQRGSEKNRCCCCDGSRNKGDDAAGLPANDRLSQMEANSSLEESGTTEKIPEEEKGRRSDAVHQLTLSPSNGPPGFSNTYCLSPEIITLNYRPLDVLLGSSSYSLCVDVWSVGCIFMELLTGCELIDGCTEFQCIVAIMRLFGNPWKKSREDDTKDVTCGPCTQGTRSRRGVTGVDSLDCSTSNSSGRQHSGAIARGDDQPQRCASFKAGKHMDVRCGGVAADVPCCCTLPAEAPVAGGKGQLTNSTRKKSLQVEKKKSREKSQPDRSSEWKFWSEALPAFQGEDRPLERILRECGRLDAVAEPHLLDLASRLLTVLPDRRITASEALLHPFFNDVRTEDEL